MLPVVKAFMHECITNRLTTVSSSKIEHENQMQDRKLLNILTFYFV